MEAVDRPAPRPDPASATTRPPRSPRPLDAAPAAHGTGWQASLELAYARDAERTTPVLRRHAGPLRVQKGFTPEGPSVWHQVIVHPPGGIAAGDSLAIDVALQPGAQALITSPGAAKWYRGDGGTASQRLAVAIGADASLEWLPLETIVFGGAHARLSSRFDLAPSARLIAGDLVCLGRPASGDAWLDGTLHVDLDVRTGGRLAFAERTRLTASPADRASAPGLGGRTAFGQLLAAGPEVDDGMVTACRDAIGALTGPEPSLGEGAVTRVDRILLVRWRGDAAEDGWRVLRAAWSALRPRLLGRAACPPRIWAT